MKFIVLTLGLAALYAYLHNAGASQAAMALTVGGGFVALVVASLWQDA